LAKDAEPNAIPTSWDQDCSRRFARGAAGPAGIRVGAVELRFQQRVRLVEGVRRLVELVQRFIQDLERFVAFIE